MRTAEIVELARTFVAAADEYTTARAIGGVVLQRRTFARMVETKRALRNGLGVDPRGYVVTTIVVREEAAR